ncbi:MAG: carbohydrate kinase family protein [Clostridia bacterium]|nr:carbohydrate kinase family protein [Clostridia bacterium]
MKNVMKNEALAIVGSTYDITGMATGDAILYDSNPSRIYGSCGGAGRNVAENMARMGIGVGLISAYGTDAFSNEMIEANLSAGMDISHCYIREGATACMYITLLDKHGELMLAAADLSLTESMEPEFFERAADYIKGFPLVFVDTNNTERSLQRIAEISKGRMFADTVSISKAARLRPILSRMDTIKTNRGELEALSGMKAERLEDIRKAAESLLEKGVKRVFVTMGKEGSCCCTGAGFFKLRAFPAEVRSVSGAGDAFAAAVTYGTLRGFTDEEILLLGTAASRIALCSPYAVNGEMSESRLLAVYGELKKIQNKTENEL